MHTCIFIFNVRGRLIDFGAKVTSRTLNKADVKKQLRVGNCRAFQGPRPPDPHRSGAACGQRTAGRVPGCPRPRPGTVAADAAGVRPAGELAASGSALTALAACCDAAGRASCGAACGASPRAWPSSACSRCRGGSRHFQKPHGTEAPGEKAAIFEPPPFPGLS